MLPFFRKGKNICLIVLIGFSCIFISMSVLFLHQGCPERLCFFRDSGFGIKGCAYGYINSTTECITLDRVCQGSDYTDICYYSLTSCPQLECVNIMMVAILFFSVVFLVIELFWFFHFWYYDYN